MKCIYKALRKMRRGEAGATSIMELTTTVCLLGVVAVMVIPIASGAGQEQKRQNDEQNDLAQGVVAVDLKNIYRDAMICYNEGSPYPMGDVYTEVDALPCLREKNPQMSETLRLVIRKKQFEVMCVAGYDTVRESTRWTPSKPYVYIHHIRTYEMDMGCGGYDENGNFTWTSAASVDNMATAK